MFNKIIDIIKSNRSFLITSHVRLDGDALGSELALYYTLADIGKNSVIYNQDETPEQYCFLPGSNTIVHELPKLEEFDSVFVLDCNALSRIGRESPYIGSMKNIINIDHHVENGSFSELTFIDQNASSTGELLYRLFQQMNIIMTRDIATNLYTAILTDTGGFRYRNTGKESLVAAGHLVEKGADPQWISENIYENDPPVKIRLLKRVLETLSFDLDGKVCSMVVSQHALKSTGALPEHTDGFVDIPRSIKGVEISILFSELSEKQFKLSLRSKGKINVEKIAKVFGGGGHINAAAFRIEGDIEIIKHRLLNIIRSSF